MIKKTSDVFISFLDILFPNKCNFCGSLLNGRNYICKSCETKLEYIKGMVCKKCGAPIHQSYSELKEKDNFDSSCRNCEGFNFSFIRNESLFIYTGMIRNLIHMFKFEKRWRLGRYFSDKLIMYKSEYIKTFDFIVSVPLTKERLKKRGYNQSSIIAEEISKKTGVVYLKDILYRQGKSKPQSSTKSVNERYANMRDEIKVKKKFENTIEESNILLFDDVLTTGITASVCSEALYRKKAKNVNLLTIARTLR